MSSQKSLLLVLPEKISSNTCRSCFMECDTQVNLINHKFDDTSLKHLYTLYCGITVQDDDSLPKNICNKCTTAILDFHIFRKKCIFSEELWQSYKDNLHISKNVQDKEIQEKQDLSEGSKLCADTVQVKEEILIKDEDSLISSSVDENYFDLKPVILIENNLACAKSKLKDKLMKCKKLNPVGAACVKSIASPQQNKIKKTYISKFCNKNCKKKPALVKHERTHTGEKPYTCPQCGHAFAVFGEMKRHTLIHTDIKPFQCQTCQRSFRRRYQLHLHEINIHKKEGNSTSKPKRNLNTPFLCSVCGKVLSNRGSLISHTRRHVGEKPYHCTECDEKYVDIGSLKYHIAKCHPKHTHICEYCGKNFAYNTYLKKHLLIHTGEKPHECSICGKRFSELGTLNKHSVIHSAEKPYACTVCFKRFNDRSTWKRHELIHSVNLHTCSLCRRVYRDPLVLQRHKLTHKRRKNDKSKPILNTRIAVNPE